jgi:hypothetical protein
MPSLLKIELRRNWMTPEHAVKIDELIRRTAKDLKITCIRLYNSGGIDVEKYSPGDYALARILFTAAMHECKDKFYPLSDDFREDLENLQHF